MAANVILVDSSFLVGLYDLKSAQHPEIVAFVQQTRLKMFVPQVIFPEVVYVLERNMGRNGVNNFIRHFTRLPSTLQEMIPADFARIHALRLQYADANLDFVDCAIIATAERLNITMIATLDTRDFTLVRPAHCDFFEIYP